MIEKCSFLVSLSLMHLEGARWLTDENPYTYEEEKGLFIPARDNLKVSSSNFPYLNVFANPLDHPTARTSHIIYLPPDLEKKRKQGLQVYKKENLGYMRIVKAY